MGVHDDICWQFIFQEMVYSVWRTRNEFNITGEESWLQISANQIVVWAKQAQIAILKIIDRNGKDLHFIHREKPLKGWTKLNIDGLSVGNLGMAGGRGIMRDELGIWKEDLK